jgi:hypothetical protein
LAREALDGEGLERDGLQGLVSALTIDQLERFQSMHTVKLRI